MDQALATAPMRWRVLKSTNTGFSSSLMCAEPIRCWSAESQLATRCAERVETRCGRVWASHGGSGRVCDAQITP